jgi:hypothetical protein
MATEPSMPAPLTSNALTLNCAPAAEIGSQHLLDLVIVEPKGRGPQGFRFQIVLDSATRGAESSLNLAAHAAGLIVTARDVDGIGNDLDLIIKSANSFTPIGIWLNNHRGGFIKADANLYAPSLWADGPLLLSANPPEVFQGAILLLHQFTIHPSTQRCPGERRMLQWRFEPTDPGVPSRLTSDPEQARAPPSWPFTHSF